MDLLGWDTGFAISLDRVNQALSAHSSDLPQRITGASAPGDQVAYTIDAACGAWQIDPQAVADGASGALFSLLIPLVSGQVSVLGMAPADVAGVVVSVEVDLRWVPTGVAAGSQARFDFPVPQSTKTGSLRQGGQGLDPTTAALLPFVVAHHLAAHADTITYVLAAVGPAAAGSWLRPAASVFSVLRDSGSGRGFLAILSALSDRDVAGLPRAVALDLPADSGEAVFVLAPSVVLSAMVLPGLASAFGIARTALHDVPGPAIQSTGGFGIGDVRSGLITYHPQVEGLTATIDNGVLVTAVHGTCDMKMNIALRFAVQTRAPLSFDAARQAVGFLRDPAPVVHKDVSIPWYDWFLGPVADAILAAVVNIIADDLSRRIDGGIAATSSLSDLPSVVAWTGLAAPRLTSARLENALVLTGRF